MSKLKELKKYDGSKFAGIWEELHKRKQCFACKAKFPDGIMNKHPGELKPLEEFFRGDFLFHLQSTHGITPDSLLDYIITSYKI